MKNNNNTSSSVPSVKCFAHSFLQKAAKVILDNPFYDEECHHGELTSRYREIGAEEMIAATAATIQTGYFPEWVDMPLHAWIELDVHVKNMEETPWFNQNHFV